MSLHVIKLILGTVLMTAGLTALLSMLNLMGRAEHKTDPLVLRRIHRTAGFIFAVLFLILALLGAKIVRAAGDGLPLRGVLHAVLGLALVAVLTLKVLFIRFYRQFLKHVPVMGMTVFILAFLIFCLSAGFTIVRNVPLHRQTRVLSGGPARLQDTARRGAALFATHCAGCHHAQNEAAGAGPGLKGILKKDKLPASGRPATLDNVRSQLIRPIGNMPPFNTLSEEQIQDLLAFLESL
jgi:cytochrome c553